MLPPTRNSRETDSVMKKPTHNKSAFSLVELLVVIAVIAIIAAIAIPNIANITGGAQDSANRRNAQNLASVASAARAAGYTNTHGTPTAWVNALAEGVSVSNSFGQLVGDFKIDGISGQALTNCLDYLSVTNDNLVYNPE
jgi:type IV pilus assembly protein PilA